MSCVLQSGDMTSIRDSNQFLINNEDDQVFIMSCTPGAKFAIYDCFVLAVFITLAASSGIQ